MGAWSGRIKWALGVLAPYALDKIVSTVFGLNFEDLLAAVGAAKLFTEGPPDAWRSFMSTFLTDWLAPAVGFVFGNFGLGFVLAALLFSIPDLPAYRRWFAQRRAAAARPKRDPAKDERLAEACEALAREFVEADAELNGIRMKHHWSEENLAGSRDAWTHARLDEAKYMEGFTKRTAPRLIKVVNELRARSMKIDTWGMHMTMQYELQSVAGFLDLCAMLLRNGQYQDPSFDGKILRPTRF